MVVCRRCDQKGVEEGGYDRADGCNALMSRFREKKAEDVPKDREDKDQLNTRKSTQRGWKVNAITRQN